MCVILVGKVKHIKKLKLEQAWGTNPHGAGIIIPGKPPRAIKGIMKLANLIAAIDLIPANKEIAVHLRQATHGAINPENTHPFQIGTDPAYIMHNGMLSGLGDVGTKGRSDSAHLAQLLSFLPTNERRNILEAIHGKYAYCEKNSVHLIGDFTLENHVYMSNTYWQAPKKTTGFVSHNYWDQSQSTGYVARKWDFRGPVPVRTRAQKVMAPIETIAELFEPDSDAETVDRLEFLYARGIHGLTEAESSELLDLEHKLYQDLNHEKNNDN